MHNSFKNTLNSMRTQVSASRTQSVQFFKCLVNVLLVKLSIIVNTIKDVTTHYLFFQKYTYKEYMRIYNTLVHRKENGIRNER